MIEQYSAFQSEIILTPIKEDDTELFDSISETISNISSAVIHDIVDAIQDTDYTKEDKVKEIVSLLVKEIQRLQKEVSLNESASNSATIQRLLSVIHSELNFIERLSNSDQERNWLKHSHSMWMLLGCTLSCAKLL